MGPPPAGGTETFCLLRVYGGPPGCFERGPWGHHQLPQQKTFFIISSIRRPPQQQNTSCIILRYPSLIQRTLFRDKFNLTAFENSGFLGTAVERELNATAGIQQQ
ncbi:hypothetical protein HRR84_000572 [Exophiala dermatitidis]|nr:hypothetical protein HRR84_000572 [Exophiala dermatitidis]